MMFLRHVRAAAIFVFALAFAAICPGAVLINEIMYHPDSENILEEYIELLNTGPTNVNLANWRFSKGVQFTFPSVALPAGGYLVVAADVATFTNKYPGVTNVVGGWAGRLSNSRNDLDLDDASGNRVDSVEYADEGDWAIRQRTPPDRGHRGWTWFAEHDGFDKSLELINPVVSNNHGQNWASSLVLHGTPGAANSVAQTNIAPLILDVQHLPVIPRSLDPVLVTARILDEQTNGISATLFFRRADTNFSFSSAPMLDDGLHNDGLPNDGVFGATIVNQPNNIIVEFYVRAIDQGGRIRTWPAPAIETNGVSLGQAANLLYQVDDSAHTASYPLYKLIMREADRLELAQIGSAGFPGESQTDAIMNSTFISIDGTGTDVRYTIGVRNRGNGSRNRRPNSYRISFNADRPWKATTALNLNGQYTHSQLLGSVLSLKAGLGGANSRPVHVRVNNLNLGTNSPTTPNTAGRMFGTVYVANEAINSDWAEHWYPDDSSGNIYRVSRDITPPDFAWRGTNHLSYTNTYFKQSNTAEDNWTDLVNMMRIVGTNDLFTTESVRSVIDVEQWMTYFAVMSLFNNRETSPNRGYNDDYFMYAGATDQRFLLMYYDLDTVIGEGDSTGSTTESIFSATSNNGIGVMVNRLMTWPEFQPIYYHTLQRLLDTTFSEAEFNGTVDQTLAGFVPATVIDRLKTWMTGRRTYVQSVIGPYLATNPPPPIAIISGEPRSPAPSRNATLTVSGAGVTQYRFKLNNGGYGSVTPAATPITLTNLPQGSTNNVFVIAAGTNGIWQSLSAPTVSRTWIVNTNVPTVRINEVLAENTGAFNHFGTIPDAIELYNEGSTTVNLAGLRLTDRIDSPNKYTFPNGTSLAPGSYLVVLANNTDGTPGLHAGFSLDKDGEGVFLFDRVANGGALLDSVQFGLQLANFSIGRIGAAGEFVLTQPTFGTNNVAQPMGDPRQLRINEWLASELAVSSTDFIELHNPEPLPVALGGLYLTDNPISKPARHEIAPLTFIGAEGFRVFKADGDPQDGLDHLNFSLAAEQGLIALLAHDLSLIDCVFYGPQQVDVSEGREPDGSNTIVFFPTPTPGAANPQIATCTISAESIPLVPLTQTWMFNQTENLDGVNWPATNYNDAAWPSGPGLLAFENNAALTPLTNTVLSDPRIPPPGLTHGHAYYFRTTFNLTNNLTGYTIEAQAYVDDGAVIYLNGTEIAPRIRMNAGVVTNTTFATGTPPGGDATSPDPFTIPISQLLPGTNTIAVEVHQNQTNSSDIVFGLALTATRQITNCGQITVVLNEVLAVNRSFTNSAGRTPDWIELLNLHTNAVDLSDMSLSDTTLLPRKWVFATNTVLASGARLVIEFDDAVPISPTNTGFNLSAGGDAVYLFKRPADGGTVLDSIRFGLQAPDFSIGRIADGSGPWILTLPTRDAANVAAGLGNPSALRINEWMASPADGDDWLELHNPDPQPIDLSGLALTDNSAVRDKAPFPSLSFIGPGGFHQLFADSTQGNGADHLNFSLNSTSGFIGLYWPIGTQIDVVAYGLQTTGVSQGRFPNGAAAIVSFPQTPSPGTPNFLLLENIFINEVLSHTDPPLEDAIELFNASSNAVDIGGWYLSNSGDELRKFLVPSNTIIAPGGFKVFYEYQFGTNTSPDALLPFALNSAHGDEVHLAQTDSIDALTGYRARVAFGAAANGVSFGRFVTSTGEEFVAMNQRTFGVDNPSNLPQFRTGSGAPNAAPLIGPVVISEIHYRPNLGYNGDTNAAEFIELLNRTPDPVQLYDSNAASNTWVIAGAVDFAFPTNIVLAATSSIVVVGFDPNDIAQSNWFSATYDLPAGTRLFGPWSGALANEGEEIRLLQSDPPQLPPAPDAGFVPYILIERVHYLPTNPWPTNGIGSGFSLQRIVPSAFGNEPLNWLTTAPSIGIDSSADSDGDGLPDYWELEHGLDPHSAAGDEGANGDPDDDNQTNRQEFLAGSDPNNAADYLRFQSITRTGSLVRLQFIAAAGRTYSVLWSGSPTGPWQKLANAPTSVNTTVVEITDPIGGAPRFYRIVAPALP